MKTGVKVPLVPDPLSEIFIEPLEVRDDDLRPKISNSNE